MLTIIARPTVDPARLDEVKAAMLELVAATLEEEGCLRYELHQDNADPTRFTFVESWESHALWRQHMDGPAVAAFNAKVSGAVTAFELQEMTPLAV